MPERHPPSLFASDHDFVREAIDAAFDDADHASTCAREVDTTRRSSRSTAARDLIRRLVGAAAELPVRAEDRRPPQGHRRPPTSPSRKLDEARQSEDSQWPEVGYLSPLHPLVDWLVDKVLVGVGRNQAPIITRRRRRADLLRAGRVVQRSRPAPARRVAGRRAPRRGATARRSSDLFDVLDSAGVGPACPTPASPPTRCSSKRPSLESSQRAHDELLERRALARRGDRGAAPGAAGASRPVGGPLGATTSEP